MRRTSSPNERLPDIEQSRADYALVSLFQLLMASKLGVIEHPVRSCLDLAIRGRSEFTFDGGLKISVSRKQLRLLRALVELSYPHGVVFGSPTTAAEGSWIVDQKNETLSLPGGLRMTLDSLLDPIVLAETFVYDLHFQGQNLQDKTVIDVGANVGDTALYFASKGATVLAYEPDPYNFVKLERNIDLNPKLKSRISLHKEAVGADGEVSFKIGLLGASGEFAIGGEQTTVRSVSLKKILKRDLGSLRPWLIKIDAKGSERIIVPQPEIGLFEKVVVEYSLNQADPNSFDLLATHLLKMGFTISRRYKHNYGFFRTSYHGTLEACKVKSPIENTTTPHSQPRMIQHRTIDTSTVVTSLTNSEGD